MPETYPVGSAWEFTAPEGIGIRSGAVGRIWLSSREGSFEIWMYDWSYADASGRECDWAPTRRKALELCKTYFGGSCKVRFKKIQDVEV